MNKKIHLFVLLSLILYSCVGPDQSNIQSTATPTSQNISVSPTNQSLTPISTNTPTPSVSVTNTPMPDKNIQSISIYDKTGNLLIDSTSQNKYPIQIKQNNFIELSVKVLYTDNSFTNKVTWQSSDESIIKVDSNGKLSSFTKQGQAQLILFSSETQKEIFRTNVVVNCGVTECVDYTDVTGNIYDNNNNPLNGVKVSIVNLDNQTYNQELITTNNTYTFKNIVSGTKVEITASKDGYMTKQRIEVLKSNITGDTTYIVNNFNFGGSNSEDRNYALEKM